MDKFKSYPKRSPSGIPWSCSQQVWTYRCGPISYPTSPLSAYHPEAELLGYLLSFGGALSIAPQLGRTDDLLRQLRVGVGGVRRDTADDETLRRLYVVTPMGEGLMMLHDSRSIRRGRVGCQDHGGGPYIPPALINNGILLNYHESLTP